MNKDLMIFEKMVADIAIVVNSRKIKCAKRALENWYSEYQKDKEAFMQENHHHKVIMLIRDVKEAQEEINKAKLKLEELHLDNE